MPVNPGHPFTARRSRMRNWRSLPPDNHPLEPCRPAQEPSDAGGALSGLAGRRRHARLIGLILGCVILAWPWARQAESATLSDSERESCFISGHAACLADIVEAFDYRNRQFRARSGLVLSQALDDEESTAFETEVAAFHAIDRIVVLAQAIYAFDIVGRHSQARDAEATLRAMIELSDHPLYKISLLSSLAQANCAAGNAEASRGQFDEAAGWLDRIATPAVRSRGLIILASHLAKCGEARRALDFIRDVDNTTVRTKIHWYLVELLLSRGYLDEASQALASGRETLRQSSERSWSHGVSTAALTAWQLALKALAEDRDAAIVAAKDNPDETRIMALRSIALVLARNGDTAGARQAIAGIENDLDALGPKVALAAALTRHGDVEAAVALAKQHSLAIERDAIEAEIILNLVFARLGVRPLIE
jgi:predicted transcriptional regulator with HTH domain